jgi:hypothetical protein
MPHRHRWLDECMGAVRNQTVRVHEHRIGVDYRRSGGAAMLNRVIDGVTTKWVFPLADDDLIDPSCIEKLLAKAEETDADMVYPWCRVTGRGGWNPNSHYDEVRLKRDNYIPATVLIKTEVVQSVGGYPDVVCEDHGMWLKLLETKRKIVCLPEVLWTYRFHRGPNGEAENVSDGARFWELKDGE